MFPLDSVSYLLPIPDMATEDGDLKALAEVRLTAAGATHLWEAWEEMSGLHSRIRGRVERIVVQWAPVPIRSATPTHPRPDGALVEALDHLDRTWTPLLVTEQMSAWLDPIYEAPVTRAEFGVDTVTYRINREPAVEAVLTTHLPRFHILDAQLFLAPDAEFPAHFSRVVEMEPELAAHFLTGHLKVHGAGARPLPASFDPSLLAPLLASEKRWIREAALLATGDLTPRSDARSTSRRGR